MKFFSRFFGDGKKEQSKIWPNKETHIEFGPDGNARIFETESRCAGCGKDMLEILREAHEAQQEEVEMHSVTSIGKDGKRIYAEYCDRCMKKFDAGLLRPPV